ncbi:MAG: glycoside hydrolase family 97 N-terminal domain-containing protein, partial [Gemmatimonadota bacterium]|nr:glycoside hydrolase family 97 N-terminal domain-containing protein [Gemmatimonadota bacterium]
MIHGNGIRCIIRSLALSAVFIGIAGATHAVAQDSQVPLTALRVASPDGRNVVMVDVREGSLYYMVQRDGRNIMLPSRLGFEFRGARALRDSLRLVSNSRKTVDNTWTQPWGEVARVRDRHNELKVSVLETVAPGRRFDVAFRAFNDGVAFRYEFAAHQGLSEFTITDELTEFAFADDARAWWIPSDVPRLDRSEMLYASSPISVIDSIQTPLTAETRDGKTFIVIHEANLIDYARMNLAGRRDQNRTLRAALAPLAGGDKVRARAPFNTPWRTIQLADRAIDLAPSVLGLNLNPPNVLGDVSWVKPMKYVGIWWGM